jgi:hypothetical protein
VRTAKAAIARARRYKVAGDGLGHRMGKHSLDDDIAPAPAVGKHWAGRPGAVSVAELMARVASTLVWPTADWDDHTTVLPVIRLAEEETSKR